MSRSTARQPPAHAGKGARRGPSAMRVVGWSLAALGIVILLSAAWLGYTGLQAKRALETAADTLAGVQNSLLDGETEGAARAVEEASLLTSQARATTADPVWRVVGSVPVVGATPRSVTLATTAADEVVSGALPKFVAAAEILDVPTLKAPDGRVDLARFPPAGEQLSSAEADLRSAEQTMAGIPTVGVPGFVSDGTAMLSTKIEEALSVSAVAGPLLQIAPGMLGAQTPQTYFIAFQSPVEARGTGGFLGSYAFLTVANGEIVEREVSTNSTLKTFPAPVADLGPDYADLYGPDVRNWTNMNLSPNFPFAGTQWAAASRDQFGQQVAGVIAVDINAMKYLLQATGPVTAPDGKVVSAENVVQYLGNDIYFEFESENSARKNYQAEIATDLLERVIALDGGTSAVIESLTASVSGRHLQLWASDTTAQQAIAATPLAGETSGEPGPFAQLVVNNGAGNKMDFYLQRKLEYAGGQCAADTRRSTIRTTLTNTVPIEGDLPRAISGRGDALAATAAARSNRTLVYLHLPVGALVEGVTVNGAPTQATFGQELGHPVVLLPLDLPAGAPVVVEVSFDEPRSNRTPTVPVQPMVLPQETLIEWPVC